MVAIKKTAIKAAKAKTFHLQKTGLALLYHNKEIPINGQKEEVGFEPTAQIPPPPLPNFTLPYSYLFHRIRFQSCEHTVISATCN
jgi:hypothetical protein